MAVGGHRSFNLGLIWLAAPLRTDYVLSTLLAAVELLKLSTKNRNSSPIAYCSLHRKDILHNVNFLNSNKNTVCYI